MVSESKKPTTHDAHEKQLDTKILRSVVLQMHEAFPKICIAWNVKGSMNKNWKMLFERLDTDGSGRLDYKEFTGALADVLKIEVPEDHLRALWAYVDHDKSELVSIEEFQHACYLLLLEDWPMLSEERLEQICIIINDAAVHEFSKEGSGVTSGNWFQIFNKFDTDESGRLGFEELEGVTRMRDPGLNLRESDLSTHDLKGLWKAIDKDCSGDVTVDEYMHFMRARGPQMHELTDYSKKMRGLSLGNEIKVLPDLDDEAREAAEALPVSALREVVLQMHEAFPKICLAWNVRNSMRGNWQMLFERLDTDGSGMLHYGEFQDAIREVLSLNVSEDKVWGLWCYVDKDRSTQVTIGEFQSALYLLLLDAWPTLETEHLNRLCEIINDAAVHEFSKESIAVSSGNWFQIFNKFDTDESGRLGWEELEGVTRMRDPGLNLREEDLSTHDLKGLWKAMDADADGNITVDEFMHFMKKYYDPMAAYTGPRHRELDDQQKATGKAMTEEALRPLVLEMHDQFDRICFAWDLRNAMNKNWAMLFERLDLDGSGRLDFDEFAAAVNDVLKCPFDDVQLYGLWCFIDTDESGEVTIKEFQSRLYILVLSGWPILKKKHMKRLCTKINDAAVHEFSKDGSGITEGNWFAIFNKFDTDESGRLGFEELEGVTRMRDPGLNLKEKDMSQDELKGLWRAIDEDSSGDVTVDEFMHFMKVHGPRFDGQFIAQKNISHEEFMRKTSEMRKSQEEKELREARKRLMSAERRRKKREEKHLENVAKLKKLRELDFREKNSPAYKKRRKRQVGQLTKLSKSPLLAGCEDIIPHLLKPGANIPMPLSVTGGRNRILALKAKRLEEAQKRAAALALARKEGSKRAVKFGAGVASAFGAAGVERAEKRAIAESNARKSASKKKLLAQAGTSGSFRKAGAARAEARAIAEAEEAERLAREAEVPQSPARPYECWCAPAPAPFAAPAPAPFEAEAEAYSEEEEVGFEDEPLAGESVYEPDDDAVASDAEEAVASDGDEPAEEELGEELMEEEEVIDEEDG